MLLLGLVAGFALSSPKDASRGLTICRECAEVASGEAVPSRLPELICGFHRRSDERPTLYPVACAPQAWAAGAVYLLLQACLGLEITATPPRLVFRHAVLPADLGSLRLTNLTVGGASVDLLIERHPHDVGITVLRRDGAVDIVVIK